MNPSFGAIVYVNAVLKGQIKQYYTTEHVWIDQPDLDRRVRCSGGPIDELICVVIEPIFRFLYLTLIVCTFCTLLII